MRLFAFALLCVLSSSVLAEGIANVRVRAEPERARIVFDLDSPINYHAFEMRNPNRVVVDIENIAYPRSLALPTASSRNAEDFQVLERLRYAVRHETGLRIVLDLNDKVALQHTVLPPRQDYGHRLVLDLYRPSNNEGMHSDNAEAEAQPEPKPRAAKLEQLATSEQSQDGAKALALLNATESSDSGAEQSAKESNSPTAEAPDRPNPAPLMSAEGQAALDETAVSSAESSSNTNATPTRDVVVAIDAGHGGRDVGAIGPNGTYEKNIVLEISQELAREINRQPGMRAILTRKNDEYVALRERMRRARYQQADLFISIHADAFKDRRVHGSSVYVLSQHGASSEAARWLAENENAADLVGGVHLHDKDDVVKSVLIDLSQTASIDASIDAADTVLSALKKVGKVHKRTVQHAGFMVLKSPDIPSLLVETAFISNPTEEKRLRSKTYQRKLAYAITSGVVNYFSENPPPETRFADNYRRQHKVTRGDTLSEIAERYAVSMESIKLANEMSRDRVRTGEILTIP
ncbi:MAG: N-acetylmuramoyl-L-alanine amidase [Pseudomonadota bacterium]